MPSGFVILDKDNRIAQSEIPKLLVRFVTCPEERHFEFVLADPQ